MEVKCGLYSAATVFVGFRQVLLTGAKLVLEFESLSICINTNNSRLSRKLVSFIGS